MIRMIGVMALGAGLAGCGAADPATAGADRQTAENAMETQTVILDTADWAAWINAMPGPGQGEEKPFYVTGRVQLPTPGYSVALRPTTPQGFNPQILMLDLVIEPPAPDQMLAQVLTWYDVRYEAAVGADPYMQVSILHGGEIIAGAAVETAH